MADLSYVGLKCGRQEGINLTLFPQVGLVPKSDLPTGLQYQYQ